MPQQQKIDAIGLIYGDVGSTKFNFTVNGHNLRKFDYVAAPHEEGYVLAQVMDIKGYSDLKFEDAITIKTNGTLPPIKSDVSAYAEVIGFRDKEGHLQAPRSPFEAGAQITLANEDLIRHVLGLQAEKQNGAYLGLLKGHDLPVYLNIDSLVQKHICILAKTGGGKSYACGVLIEELLKKKIPLVIIDTHGEYTSLGKPNKDKKDEKNMEKFGVKANDYASQITAYSPLNSEDGTQHLTLNGLCLEGRDILELLQAKLSGPQIAVLYQTIKELKEFKENYTIRDIIEAVEHTKSNARWNVIASLESLDSIGVFSDKGTEAGELVQKGKCSIINMRGVPPDIQDVVVARLTEELFKDRKAGKIPPFLFVVEEAHNYCPEHGIGHAVSSQMLRTVASEGRKFGMGLCVVSQRPAKIDKNIISQCNTNIILKVTNPNDLKAIIQSVEGLTSQTYDEIQRLPIGVALISGASIQVPILVEIRTRETDHGGKSVTVFKDIDPSDYKPKLPKAPPLPSQQQKEAQKHSTEKAMLVHRVATRLGWVKTKTPDQTIQFLSAEAEEMQENVFKYLDSLAQLGKTVCHEASPSCAHCPMNSGCQHWLAQQPHAPAPGPLHKHGLLRRSA